VWPKAAGALYRAGQAREGGARGFLQRQAEAWAARLWYQPANRAFRFYRRARRAEWRSAELPSVSALLEALDRTPDWLLVDFLTGVRVDPRARGFFHDRKRRVVWCHLVGLDLIPTDEGIWCIEGNLNTAFNAKRRAILDPEPAVKAAFDLAQELGFQRVWWEGMDFSELRPWLIADLQDEARSRGMEAVFREDYRVRPSRDLPGDVPPPPKRLHSPLRPPEGTLVVRRNCYWVGTDWAIADKGPFLRGLVAEKVRDPSLAYRVPAMSRRPRLGPTGDHALPNLVYKYPDMGKGVGVFFLRVDDADEAEAIARRLDRERGEPPGLFQPFVVSRLLPGRRIYDVRAEILVTPFGPRFVYSTRREAMKSLPDSISRGLLDGAGVFTSNLATGGRFAPLDPAEVDEVEEAALGVGEATVRMLRKGFVTETGG
jgi:hypothetical protein